MITLKFDNLTAEQARALLAAYERTKIQVVADPEIRERIATTAAAPEFQAAPAPTFQAAPAPVYSQPTEFAPPTFQAAPTTAASPLDIEGVPYNAELHAPLDGKTGGKLTTGAWKANRKADRAAYEAWRSQHIKTPNATPTPNAFTQPTEFTQPTVTPAPNAFTQPTVTPAPNAFTQPAPTAAPVDTTITEAELLEKSGILAARGLLPQQTVAEIIRRAGASDNIDLVRDPGKRAVAWQCLLQLEATGNL